jgi:type V secretory pathway adhesin AidA
MRWRVTAATVATAALLLAGPPAAPAATSCDYGASGKALQVQLSATDDVAGLGVSAGGEIVVRNAAGVPLTCGPEGPATVTNTNVINVFNQPGVQGTWMDIQGAGNFVPGADLAGGSGGTPSTKDTKVKLVRR